MHITGLSRTGLFPTYEASYAVPLYPFCFGLVTMALGLMLLNRHYRQLLNL